MIKKIVLSEPQSALLQRIEQLLRFKDLLKGDYSIDEKIAERLQDLFGIDADYWIKLQRNYDRMISEGKPKLKI